MQQTLLYNWQAMALPNCSIIIRAYNEEKHISRLLEGILQQSIKDVELILVDSGSRDATVAIASRYPVKIVHIPSQDFSFGRSLNFGIQHAQSDLLVFASAHVYPVYPDWLEKLLAPFSDPQVALTYGRQRGNKDTKFTERQIFTQWYPEISQPRQHMPFCNNANAAVRRELVIQRPYNESLPGLEDLEWAQWAINQGWFIHYAAEAEIIHVHEETPRGVYNRYRREAMAFKQIYSQEKFNLLDFLRLVIINITSDLRQAARQGVLAPNLASIFWFRWVQFWGTYQGYRHPGPLTSQLRQTFYYPRGLSQSDTSGNRTIKPIHYHSKD